MSSKSGIPITIIRPNGQCINIRHAKVLDGFISVKVDGANYKYLLPSLGTSLPYIYKLDSPQPLSIMNGIPTSMTAAELSRIWDVQFLDTMTRLAQPKPTLVQKFWNFYDTMQISQFRKGRMLAMSTLTTDSLRTSVFVEHAGIRVGFFWLVLRRELEDAQLLAKGLEYGHEEGNYVIITQKAIAALKKEGD